MRLPIHIGGARIQSDQLLRPPTTIYRAASDAAAVATPERPDYWLGNLLALAAPPRAEDVARWRALWAREVAAVSGATHPLVQFELPWGAGADEVPAPPGVTVEWDAVLRAPAELAPRAGHAAQELTSEADWQALHGLLAVDEIDEAAPAEMGRWQADFLRWRLGMYHQRAAAGQAAFFGVWRDGALVGAAGILWDAALGLARYQAVVTHPAHRRQGICGDLLAAAHRRVADHGWPVIIVADRGSAPERLYAGLGFAPVSRCGTWHLEDAP